MLAQLQSCARSMKRVSALPKHSYKFRSISQAGLSSNLCTVANRGISTAPFDGVQLFPSQSGLIANGLYKIKSDRESEIKAPSTWTDNKCFQDLMWFKTEPLTANIIERIHSLQLFTESKAELLTDSKDEKSAKSGVDNWTWFDLAILDKENPKVPKINQGLELVNGEVFRHDHYFLRLLEAGDVLAVRVCAGYPGAYNVARSGVLKIEIGDKIVGRVPIRFDKNAESVKKAKVALEVVKQINSDLLDCSYTPWVSTGAFRADYFDNFSDNRLRVLSLNGGGVRGLASLYLLKNVMKKVGGNLKTNKPYQIFDMIGGTSTGGLIAIMLGRLRMDIDECIVTYNKLMGDIFDVGELKKWMESCNLPNSLSDCTDLLEKGYRVGKNSEIYSHENLERAIKNLVREKLGSEDASLREENPACKIFVLAVREDAVNNRSPVFLRSYMHPHEPRDMDDVKIWQAARATSAAPTYFSPIKVGGYKLVDGGLAANNPLGWLWTEVLSVYGLARKVDCFLSIGTGIAANKKLLFIQDRAPSHSALVGAVTNSEITHNLFRTLLTAFSPNNGQHKYWRLNIEGRIEEKDDYKGVGKLDDVKALKPSLERATVYCQSKDGYIQECANAISAWPHVHN